MSDRLCNFCMFDGFKKMADQQKRQIMIVPNPIKGFPDGVDVLIGGVFCAWFAALPTECHC